MTITSKDIRNIKMPRPFKKNLDKLPQTLSFSVTNYNYHKGKKLDTIHSTSKTYIDMKCKYCNKFMDYKNDPQTYITVSGEVYHKKCHKSFLKNRVSKKSLLL